MENGASFTCCKQRFGQKFFLFSELAVPTKERYSQDMEANAAGVSVASAMSKLPSLPLDAEQAEVSNNKFLYTIMLISREETNYQLKAVYENTVRHYFSEDKVKHIN